MPYITEYIQPELFLEHKGKRIYHAYTDRDFELKRHCTFTTDPDENAQYEFDVRDFGKFDSTPDLCQIKAVIREAIDKGLVTFPDDD